MFIIKTYDGNFMTRYIMYSFHEEIMGISGECNTEYQNKENLMDYFKSKYGRLPDSILFLWNFSKEIYNKIRAQLPLTKIILWTDDLHWFTKEVYDNNYFSYLNADIHLSHYDYFKLFYNIDVTNKLIKMYHSCSSHFLKNEVNINAINKIYMYGATDTIHYRLRVWFIDNMKLKYPHLFVQKHHPGYNGNKNQESINTANELYKYKICYTASLFPKFEISETQTTPYYLIGKFLEIPGSGALLLCNDYGIKEQLNELGFYDMEHYVNINENNFDEMINWLFDPQNENKIMEFRKNGHQLVKNKHITIKRVNNINNKLELLHS